MNIFQETLALRQQQELQALRTTNSFSARFGLVLREEEMQELLQARREAVRAAGRVEFGGGILPKLIYALCDSPFLDQQTYAATLAELQEAFYYFKTEARERFSDDELVEFMAAVFNGRVQGSAEYLIGTSLEALCRYAREPFDPQNGEEAGDLF